jgi:hypothetical protein
MKKFFENRPRTWFFVEILVVIVLVMTAFVAGYFYKDAEEIVVEKLEYSVANLTETEIAENMDKVSITGTLTKIDDATIQIRSNDKLFSYSIDGSTRVTKGVSGAESKISELTIGTEVSLQVTESDKKVLTIWWKG